MLDRTDPVSFSTEVPPLVRQQKDGFRCCIFVHGNLNRILGVQLIHANLLAVYILHRNGIRHRNVHLFLSAGFRQVVTLDFFFADLLDHDGKGVDVVLDCAGFSQTVADAVNLTRSAGRIVVVGMGADQWQGIPFGPITSKELEITSIFRYKNLYPTAIAAVASGRIDVSGIVSKTFSFEQTPEAFESAYKYATETVKNVIVF